MGALHPDRRRPHRRADAAPGEARAPFVQYHAPIAWTTLRADDPRRRHARGATGRGVAVPAPLGLRRRRHASSPRAAWPTSRSWAGNAFGRRTPWGDEDSPALVTAVETALERELSNVDHAGGDEADDPPCEGGRGARRPGRPSDEICTSCSTACWPSRSTATEWPRSGPGAVLGERAALEGGTRTATLRAVTPMPGRRRCRSIADRPRRAGRSWPRATAVRSRRRPADAGPPVRGARARRRRRAEFDRRRRQHVVRRRRPRRRGRAAAGARRRDRAAHRGRAARTARRFGARSCSGTCTGTTPRACRSSPPATGLTPGSTCTCWSPQGAAARGAANAIMGPPFFPITRRALQGDVVVRSIDEGDYEIEGFNVLVAGDPAHGRPHVRLPRQRRALAAWPMSPTTARSPSGPGPDGGGRTTRRSSSLADGVDLLLHDAQYTAAELACRPISGTRAVDYAVALAERVRRRAGCCCSTTTRRAPTTRSTPSSTASAAARSRSPPPSKATRSSL